VEIIVARQPIFDRSQQVYGYELLFRQGLGHIFDMNEDSATSVVLTGSFSLIGIETLTSGKRAFINLGNVHIKFLAEKVETQTDLQMAIDFGYDYIQGYFFSKPETLRAQDIPGYKLNYLYTLYEINQPQVNFDSLEQAILREVSLSYKLLRFINSAYFNLRHRIKTVRHALMLLGADEIRKWASLVVLSGMGDDKPDDLAVLSALRGKFCELLGIHSGFEKNRTDLYLMGLFSMMDAFTDYPLAEVLKKLPLHVDVKRALQSEGGCFADIYQLALAYEGANWPIVTEICTRLRISEGSIPKLYQDAVSWVNQIFYDEEQSSV
jgi:c-di-GMP-related signal transduction protein